MARLSLLVPASSQLRLEAIAKFFKLLGEAPVEESRLADRFSQIFRLFGGSGKAPAAYTLQVETLRRLRSGGAQHVRVEHVHINDQAQALIGPVSVSQNREEE